MKIQIVRPTNQWKRTTYIVYKLSPPKLPDKSISKILMGVPKIVATEETKNVNGKKLTTEIRLENSAFLKEENSVLSPPDRLQNLDFKTQAMSKLATFYEPSGKLDTMKMAATFWRSDKKNGILDIYYRMLASKACKRDPSKPKIKSEPIGRMHIRRASSAASQGGLPPFSPARDFSLFPNINQISSPQQREVLRQFLPSLARYGLGLVLLLALFTEWKAVLQYLPFYGGKYKQRKTAKD